MTLSRLHSSINWTHIEAMNSEDTGAAVSLDPWRFEISNEVKRVSQALTAHENQHRALESAPSCASPVQPS